MFMQTKTQHAVFAGIIVIVLIILGYVFSNIRITSSGFTRTGTIEVADVPENASIYLDNELVISQGENTSLRRLTPGVRTVLVAKSGYWPWSKKVIVPSDEIVTIEPFLIKQRLGADILEPGTPEHAEAKETLNTNINLPTSESPLLSPNERTEIWTDNGHIQARWLADTNPPQDWCAADSRNDINSCPREITIFESEDMLQAIDYYDNRDDVILFSTGVGIFALEIANDELQNFQPVFRGTVRNLATADEDTVFIEDRRNRTLELTFE